MKKLISVLGLGLALSLGGVAIAGDHYGHAKQADYSEHMERGERMMRHMFSRLDLSTEQRDAIHSIRDEAHEAMDAYREQAKGNHEEFKTQMKAIVQAENFDEQSFRELMKQKQTHKGEMAVIKAKMKNKIWNVLNEEQQVQMNEMMEKRGKRRWGHKWH